MLNYGLIVKPQNMVKLDPCIEVFKPTSGLDVFLHVFDACLLLSQRRS